MSGVLVEVHEDDIIVETHLVPAAAVVEVGVPADMMEVYPPGGMRVEVLVPSDPVSVEVPVFAPMRVEVQVPPAPELVEVYVAGPQGVPGDTRIHIGDTPPSDTSMIWINTS